MCDKDSDCKIINLDTKEQDLLDKAEIIIR